MKLILTEKLLDVLKYNNIRIYIRENRPLKQRGTNMSTRDHEFRNSACQFSVLITTKNNKIFSRVSLLK